MRPPTIRRLAGLKMGRSILLEGKVDENAKAFSVNLQSNGNLLPHTDVLFMCNPCFGQDGCTVVCNSYLYESWGTADTFQPKQLLTKRFPFTRGEPFSMRIAVLADHYEVLVNEVSVLVFNHRVSWEKITHIRLEGDAHFEFIQCPRQHKMPYILDLPHGLRDGHVLVMDTFMKPQTKTFQVHVTAKNQEVYAGFFARISFAGVITKVYCQAFLNDKRDEEVTIDGHLPILRNRELELRAVIGKSTFQIFVDGEWFADYDHNLPIEKLNCLTIEGDIALYETIVHKPRGRYKSVSHKSKCCECSLM